MMTTQTRVLALSLAIAAVSLLVAVGLLFLVWPTWLTGGVCELTVADILFDEVDGRVEIFTSTVLPYGAEMQWDFPPDRTLNYTFHQSWDQEPSPFLRWPSYPRPGDLMIPLVIDAEKQTVPERIESVKARLLLRKGVYRLRVGEQLVYYRRQDEEGRTVESVIRCRSKP